VSRFALSFGERTRSGQLDSAVDWCRYAKPTPSNNKCFLIPYSADRDLAVQGRLQEHKICERIDEYLRFWQDAVENIRAAARNSSLAPQHGNVGKRNRERKILDSPAMILLQDHFNQLISWSEVQATRFVREMMGEVTKRDAGDVYQYLPTSMWKRHCYRRYCPDNGYRVVTNSTGKSTLEAKPDEAMNKVVRWSSMYWNFWQREYPHLKVNKLSEDICGYCYRFHNRHKYKTNLPSTANVGAEEGGK
jgi:hypothetical protein